MKRDAIEELYAYTGFQWDRLTRVMESLPADDFTKPVGDSGWPSLQRAFLHFVGSYDAWINDDWGLGLGKSPYADVESWDELAQRLTTWEELKAYREAMRTAFQEALSVPDEQLFAKKTWNLEDIGPEELSRGDILTNLLVHEIAHRGDISTLFHQLGLKHLLLDYRFFISKPDEYLPDTE